MFKGMGSNPSVGSVSGKAQRRRRSLQSTAVEEEHTLIDGDKAVVCDWSSVEASGEGRRTEENAPLSHPPLSLCLCYLPTPCLPLAPVSQR